jgi:prepilin peptidase CpaA
MASTFLAVGFVLYLLKVMGAGDSKYLFSFFLLIPPAWLDTAFFDLLVCTMVIGSFSLFTTIAQNFQRMSLYARTGYIRGFRECLGTKFPFAPVIFISWAWLGIKVFYLGL